MTKDYPFENAFAMVRIRWEKHFRETSSFYFGIQFSESKIVVKKAAKMFKSFFVLYLIAYFLPLIILKFVSIKVDKGFADFVNGFLTLFSLVGIFYILFVAFKMRELKVKTTYGFILRTQYLGVIFLILGALVGKVFNSKSEMEPIFTGFVFAGLSVVFIIHHFYKKHLEAINKHQIL